MLLHEESRYFKTNTLTVSKSFQKKTEVIKIVDRANDGRYFWVNSV